MTDNERSLIERAQRVAEVVLYPDAAAVDQDGVVPARHWEALAEEGLYGAAVAGLELSDIARIIEVLAGGCLSTAFIWMQHHSAVRSLANTANTGLREIFFADLLSGRKRAGAAFAGAVAQPAKLSATRVGGGYLLTGDALFVSGWGVVDLLQVAARERTEDATDTVVSGLIEATAAETLSVTPVSLVAGQATATVRMQFDNHLLPDHRVSEVAAFSDFCTAQTIGSRLNGAVACGVAERAIDLLELTSAGPATLLREQWHSVHAGLDDAMPGPDVLQKARAVALRSAAALFAASGSAALQTGHPAERLMREATFTLVATSLPDMRALLVDGFARG
ncbi:acyl-CoA/acyl-ACP dehydrogenase [Nocardia cyriacigeorgica]|uniref:Acyl-CoA/acyl-ACP dehydrogenase n=1 Tax=Nocardia cyriacigeorgica TaxID=135487 RepID=A0A6P1DAK2_9NOCA|nr:acyl-CoA dehydrogenase family protein [Nocardia cyriacigeorgica]NEW41556.1 acyl-CoA/acyl-ACP dehydrogenase [Nocardia cyriacigeorgica]NEW47746.1 acyl-CoA/acyl-ACP dehydrogenase [Nocardia cyriacigeorgica]NEW52370.1 acyl-CoA/acyl-ACP dehydrogenase [Nocardia cyriacigeorgica]NEW56355.1 acyl-CoA/acyl-ACP dehydrogenase [Nocardia cyriacigeorgica]